MVFPFTVDGTFLLFTALLRVPEVESVAADGDCVAGAVAACWCGVAIAGGLPVELGQDLASGPAGLVPGCEGAGEAVGAFAEFAA